MITEAMKQALEALQEAVDKAGWIGMSPEGWDETQREVDEYVTQRLEPAITALRTAIAEAEKQEPVAWLYWDSWGTMKLSQIMPPPVGAFPVYTTPPAAQPAQQEPVAWAVFEGWNAHDLYLPQEYDEALKMAGYKGDHAEVKPLYTHPSAAQPAPVQVSPTDFVDMVMDKEDAIGKPIFWAEWPNREKNT